jgi:hypothetical protein
VVRGIRLGLKLGKFVLVFNLLIIKGILELFKIFVVILQDLEPIHFV